MSFYQNLCCKSVVINVIKDLNMYKEGLVHIVCASPSF